MVWSNGEYYVLRISTNDQDDTEGGHMSELTLRDASVDDSGIYVCLASNNHGSLASDFQLSVQGKLKKSSMLVIINDL